VKVETKRNPVNSMKTKRRQPSWVVRMDIIMLIIHAGSTTVLARDTSSGRAY